LVLDDLGTILAANPAAAQMFGLTGEELVGRDVATVMHGSSGTTPWRGEIERRDGTLVAASVFDRRVLVDGRDLVIRQVYDATLTREREGRLHRAVEQLRVIFHRAPIGIALATLDGEIVEANEALCEMLGRSRDQVVGHPRRALIHPLDQPMAA